MTIDERLEAITQTLELTVLENRNRDARWEKQQAEWEKRQAEWEKRQVALDKKFAFIGESLEKLANIAMLHQHRLDSHEDRLDTLEGTA